MTVAVSLDVLPRRRVADVARDYVALTKPRVILLLEVTAVAAMVIADRGWPGWRLVLLTVAGGWLAASGANAINCWFDRDIDQTMGRTRTRPLPSGRIEPRQALAFGVAPRRRLVRAAGHDGQRARREPGAARTALLRVRLHDVAEALLDAEHRHRRRGRRDSPAGRLGGGDREPDITAVFLFAVVFYWTPPHFWALSLLIKSDYARAGVPMMPVVQGDRQTRYQIVLYTIVLCLVTVLPLLTRSFGARLPGGCGGARRDPADRRRGRRPAPDGALGTPALLPFNDLPGSALRGHGDRPRDRALRRTRR